MLGVISALSFENQGLMNRLKIQKTETICGIVFSIAAHDDKKIVIAACGEGKVNAARCAQIMVTYYKVSKIINIGVAGALDDQIKPGDLIVAETVVQHDFDMTPINVPLGLVPMGERTSLKPWGNMAEVFYPCSKDMISVIDNILHQINAPYHKGTIATGDVFVSSRNQREYIQNSFSAIACDMEGAAIAHVCKAAQIEFGELRKISDCADEGASKNYLEYRSVYSIEEIALMIICAL